MQYSKGLIRKTLKLWGPKYQTMGIVLTEEDAIEILNNMNNLVTMPYQLDQKYPCDKKGGMQ